MLTFESFDIEAHPSCKYDYVQVSFGFLHSEDVENTGEGAQEAREAVEAVDTAGVVEAQPGQQGRQEEEAEGAEETSCQT